MTEPSDHNLEQLRAVDKADIYKGGQRAATFVRTDRGVEFRYLDEWTSDQRPPIATTLPVTTRPIARFGGALPAYFSGLLPEGRRLGALRRL